MERILFIKKFPAEIWKNIKDEMREIFKKELAAIFLNQIHKVINIENKVRCEWTGRLF